MTSNSDEIVLPCNITDEIHECQKIITQEKINSSLADISYLYHLYQIRWVANQFWDMKTYHREHRRKIDSLTKYRNFPTDWLPSSIKVPFNHGMWAFTKSYKYILSSEAVLDHPPEF
jgi:hypothetical protein